MLSGGSFDVQLAPDQLIWVGLVIGIVQVFKDIPALAFFREWLPLVVLVLCVGLAFGLGWTNPIPSGLVLGLMTLGTYKAGTTSSDAMAKRQNSSGPDIHQVG